MAKEEVEIDEVEVDLAYGGFVQGQLKRKGIDARFWKGRLYVSKKEIKKAKEILKRDPNIDIIPAIIGEEVEIKEGLRITLKKLKKQYDKNEDENQHTENYLLLAKAFGTPAEVKNVEIILAKNQMRGYTSKTDDDWMYKNLNKYYNKIRNEETMKRNEKQGHTSKSDMDWMYKNINPYYDKIRNEETMKLEDTVKQVLETNKNDKSDDGDGLDAVQPKAVKKKFKDRKDKDIDNDGDTDDSDKFLHKKRKAISKAMSKEDVKEAHWKVNIPDMPPVFIEGGSSSEIKKDMRKKLKPDVYKELAVERVTKSEMIKKYREMVKGEGGEEEPKEESKLFNHVKNLMKGN